MNANVVTGQQLRHANDVWTLESLEMSTEHQLEDPSASPEMTET